VSNYDGRATLPGWLIKLMAAFFLSTIGTWAVWSTSQHFAARSEAAEIRSAEESHYEALTKDIKAINDKLDVMAKAGLADAGLAGVQDEQIVQLQRQLNELLKVRGQISSIYALELQAATDNARMKADLEKLKKK